MRALVTAKAEDGLTGICGIDRHVRAWTCGGVPVARGGRELLESNDYLELAGHPAIA